MSELRPEAFLPADLDTAESMNRCNDIGVHRLQEPQVARKLVHFVARVNVNKDTDACVRKALST